MNPTIKKLTRGALCLGVLAACLASTPALAQIEIRISPPVWFIATTSPVYYEGHASYWYGNQWHYREGRTWHTYREEPSFLRQHRDQHRDDRHYYGRERDDRGKGNGNHGEGKHGK